MQLDCTTSAGLIMAIFHSHSGAIRPLLSYLKSICRCVHYGSDSATCVQIACQGARELAQRIYVNAVMVVNGVSRVIMRYFFTYLSILLHVKIDLPSRIYFRCENYFLCVCNRNLDKYLYFKMLANDNTLPYSDFTCLT